MDELYEVKSKINLLQYIQSVYDLGKSTKTSGGLLFKNCPMCNSTSSKTGDAGHFFVNDSTNSYSSFTGCCKGGSIIDFIMEYYNLDTKEAIEKAKDIAGIKRSGDVKQMYDNNKRLANVSNSNTQQSKEEADKKEYIREQKKQFILNGIQQQTEEQKQKLYEYLESRNLSKTLVEKYKLFYSNNVYEDKTQGIEGTPRMVIPVFMNGQPFSYVARALTKVDSNIKALNSAMTGQMPLNIECLKEEPKENKFIYICEGWADTFSIEETGNKSIALHSTQNVKKLLEYITQHKQTASKYFYVLCGDNDEAGQKANEEMKKYFAENKIKNITLNIEQPYHDINEWYIGIADKEVFKKRLNPFYKQTTLEYIDNSFLKDVKRLQEYKSKSTGFKNLDREINGIYPRTICNRGY